ncbi:exonuclease domain-containing protein [Burkholderiaceae bacterium DAT-1]|nr:exonuclease domain-containing protein [Burkholderiaceae bacterium DAT-1]
MMLIIDLEATCDEGDALPAEEMEIIEIGAVWADATGQVLAEYQSFVRPVLHPTLTPFCTQLTGIQQHDVDQAATFPAVATQLQAFAMQYEPSLRSWGSWGQYDCRQLARECARHGVPHPLSDFEHVNLKRLFARQRRIKEVGMARALAMTGLPLQGTHHRGLDDARNIARLLAHMHPLR